MPRNGSSSNIQAGAGAGGMARNGSASSLGGHDQNSSPGPAQTGSRHPSRPRNGPPESVFDVWKASERVTALTDEQIADIRQRLNVTVVVQEGEQPAIAPIESFQDMVRCGMVPCAGGTTATVFVTIC